MLSGSPVVTKIEVASTDWSTAFLTSINGSNSTAVGYAIPLGSNAQSATLTWDNIDQIAITFNEDVIVDASDFSLSGVSVSEYVVAAFRYDPLKFTAIWTLTTEIDSDRVRIDLDASGADPVRDLLGNVLDGEWSNNVSVMSGNNVAGGDFEFTFNVLPTDVNNTGNITSYDYVYIRQLDGKTSTTSGYISKRDIDGNGIVNSVDWQKALDRALEVLPSGAAAGTFNDAPTSQGPVLVSITSGAVDTAVSLLSYFDDQESGSSGLTYSIVSNSNPEFFDTAAIDSSNHLLLRSAGAASGRATIVVRATDAAGLSVDTDVCVDVNRENQPPVIDAFTIGDLLTAGMVWVSGHVVDDGDVSKLYVQLTGVINVRAAVDENGNFGFAWWLPEGTEGLVKAQLTDQHDSLSNERFAPVQVISS
jgi:hypothetical protein